MRLKAAGLAPGFVTAMHVRLFSDKRLLAAAAALALAACAQTQAETPRVASSDQVATGRAIAQAECASCHAVGETGASPLPDAPAFRHIRARYRFDVLAEELRAGIHVGDARMPAFDLSVQQIDALIAYLGALETEGAQNGLRP